MSTIEKIRAASQWWGLAVIILFGLWILMILSGGPKDLVTFILTMALSALIILLNHLRNEACRRWQKAEIQATRLTDIILNFRNNLFHSKSDGMVKNHIGVSIQFDAWKTKMMEDGLKTMILLALELNDPKLIAWVASNEVRDLLKSDWGLKLLGQNENPDWFRRWYSETAKGK